MKNHFNSNNKKNNKNNNNRQLLFQMIIELMGDQHAKYRAYLCDVRAILFSNLQL